MDTVLPTLLDVRLLAQGNEDQRSECRRLLPLVVTTPDLAAEFLTLYWRRGKQPLAACVKKGLAAALTQFTVDQLDTYVPTGPVTLRDVLFLIHAKPATPELEAAWRRLVERGGV